MGVSLDSAMISSLLGEMQSFGTLPLSQECDRTVYHAPVGAAAHPCACWRNAWLSPLSLRQPYRLTPQSVTVTGFSVTGQEILAWVDVLKTVSSHVLAPRLDLVLVIHGPFLCFKPLWML